MPPLRRLVNFSPGSCVRTRAFLVGRRRPTRGTPSWSRTPTPPAVAEPRHGPEEFHLHRTEAAAHVSPLNPLLRWATIQVPGSSDRWLRKPLASRLEYGQGSAWMALTSHQVALIGRHYEFCRKLDQGERTPTTALQRQFVQVCRGRRQAVTPHEIAYMEFKRSRQKGAPGKQESRAEQPGKKETHRLSRKAKPASYASAKPARSSIDRKNIHLVDPRASKPWARRVDEPIGSREDFKRDSGRNRSRTRQAE